MTRTDGLQRIVSNRRSLAVIALAILAGLAGCVGGDSGPEPSENTNASTQGEIILSESGHYTSGDSTVTRFVDREAGVVCYKYDDKMGGEYGHAGGLSCLPIEQTDLDQTSIDDSKSGL